MGFLHKHYIEAAGCWLLKKLSYENPLRFSQICPAANSEQLEAIGESLGIPSDISFAHCVDVAVFQLAKQGIVTKTDPPDVPLDDVNVDCEIFLNKKTLPEPSYVGMDL